MGAPHFQAVVAALAMLAVGGPGESRTYPGMSSRAMRILQEPLPAPYEKLKPLHEALPAPARGDWLAEHRESGQSFAAYKKAQPVRPTERRRFIKIMPLGPFSPKQWEILQATRDYMERFYGVRTIMLPARGLRGVPGYAQRMQFGQRQLLTSWIREKVLMPARRGDVLACIGFTATDLWPGEGWNFVYGEASLRERVGVWSIARNGDPELSPEDYALCLRRTLKTGVHETGHILTMRHCIAYHCLMNGSNHREESDNTPLFLCPNCLAKLCWNTSQEPAVRYKSLLEFFKEHGMEEEQRRCEAFLAQLAQ